MFLGFVDKNGKTLKDVDLVKDRFEVSVKVSATNGFEIRIPNVKGENHGDSFRTIK